MMPCSVAGRARGPIVGVLLALAVLLAAALIWRAAADGDTGANQQVDREHPIVTAPRIAMQDGHSVIRLDAAALARAAIRTESVRRAARSETMRAYATVIDLQPLAELSATVHETAARAASAQAKLAASRAEYERAQHLFEDQQNVSAAQLQASQAAFMADQSTLAATQAEADAARTNARLAWGPLLGGALLGSDPGAEALLKDLLARRQVLVQVTLPADLADPTVPQRGHVLLDDRQGPQIRLLGPAAHADPRVAGRSYWYRSAAESALIAGTSLPVLLSTGRTIEAAPVPASALLWWQGRAWIFVRTPAGDFERRELSLDQARESPTPQADLQTGAEVVVQGAQVLLSEELRAENSSTDVGGR